METCTRMLSWVCRTPTLWPCRALWPSAATSHACALQEPVMRAGLPWLQPDVLTPLQA